ncbi:MAG TPA: hypothetical protein VIT67_12265 [Povalibacter sp.]
MRVHVLSAGALAVLAGCSGESTPTEAPPKTSSTAPAVTSSHISAAELPPDVASVVNSAVPGITIKEAERKEREGRVYYDVEGTRPDGSEVELDLLQENGQYRVVEIQRDIAWADAPESARAAAATSSRPFEPARVIESTQTDGSVIYELFSPDAPAKPALEVRVVDGSAEVLKEEWPH